jgi:hypothetical protein
MVTEALKISIFCLSLRPQKAGMERELGVIFHLFGHCFINNIAWLHSKFSCVIIIIGMYRKGLYSFSCRNSLTGEVIFAI